MALTYSCDSCGMRLAGLSKEYGIVHKTVYCAKCEPLVLQYLHVRDRIHEELAEQWQLRHAKLIADWHEKHPGGRLPDEEPA